MLVESLRGCNNFKHTKEDDMESLFYVTMYGSIRLLPHEKVEDLGEWIYEFFDRSKEKKGQDIGGERKEHIAVTDGRDFFELFKFDNCYIETWFTSSYGYLATFHKNKYEPDSQLPQHQWTMENVKRLINTACDGLAETDGTDSNRIDHSVKNYYIAINEAHHGTITSLI